MMALTLEQYLKNPITCKVCPECTEQIKGGEPTGKHFVNEKEVCPDCYFDVISTAVELNPLGKLQSPSQGSNLTDY